MPSSNDSPPLRVIELITAQEIPLHVAAAVEGLLPILSQQPRNMKSEAPSLPVRDLMEIITFGARVVEGFRAADGYAGDAADAATPSKAEGAQQKAKTWGIVGAVVVVIVAVIVAVISSVVTVFTFSTGTLMGAAVAGVSFPLNAAGGLLVDFFTVAARGGHPLAAETAAIMSKVMTAFRRFVNASLIEGTTARDEALREVFQALVRLDGLIPAVNRIEGPCLGDPTAILQTCRALSLIITRLTEGLWFARSTPSAEVQEVARALDTVRQALAQAQS